MTIPYFFHKLVQNVYGGIASFIFKKKVRNFKIEHKLITHFQIQIQNVRRKKNVVLTLQVVTLILLHLERPDLSKTDKSYKFKTTSLYIAKCQRFSKPVKTFFVQHWYPVSGVKPGIAKKCVNQSKCQDVSPIFCICFKLA